PDPPQGPRLDAQPTRRRRTVAGTPERGAGPRSFDRAKSHPRSDVSLGAHPYRRGQTRKGRVHAPMPKRALITGASRGLGLALARSLATDGWELIIDARGERGLRNAAADLGRTAAVHAVPGDVADEAHRLDLAAAVDALGGGLDLLVYNASLLGPSPAPRG